MFLLFRKQQQEQIPRSPLCQRGRKQKPYPSLLTTFQLKQTTAASLPSDYRNPVKQAKSPNRLVAGLHAGRLVVAHPLPAYQPYAKFAWVGEDLRAGLEWAIRHPREVVERIAAGQACLDEKHSPETVARFWLDVFNPKSKN